MGVVIHEVCPKCKQDVYLSLDCPSVRCPNCKETDIVNSRRKNQGKRSRPKTKRYVFPSRDVDVKIKNCPKCGTNFSSSPSLGRGKVFCPNCNNPLAPKHEE